MKHVNITHSFHPPLWRIKLNIVVFGVLAYLLLGLFPSRAEAAMQTLKVSPVIVNVSLSPGKTYTHKVTVENLTNAPMPLRVSLNDFITSSEEGGYVFEETADNPLLSWIRLSESEMILNPKEKKVIIMTIQTPKSISLGGYYGVLFFEPVVQTQLPDATRVSSKVGVLMLANIGVPDPNAQKAEILEFSTPFIDEDGDIPFMLRVKNISLNFFTAKPIVTISPLVPILAPQSLGNVDSSHINKSVTLEDKIVFPGKVRRWTEETTLQDLSPNIYKAQMAVSTGNGQYVTTVKYIVVFPLIKAAGIVMIVLVLLFILTKRKRLKKALAELVK